MMHRRRYALLAASLLVLSSPLAAQPWSSPRKIPQAQDAAPGELIVLLADGDGAPTPEAVVESHRRGLRLLVGAGVERPREVRPALAHRAQGRLREQIEADPDGPRARLERYLLLRFPEGADLDAVQAALERDPHVLHVERNHRLRLHVVPSDPLFQAAAQPVDYQWGMHLLGLPEAWEYAKGHAYVGLVDTGLQVTHSELRPFHADGGTLVYDGGRFRAHLSSDLADEDANVDELGPDSTGQTPTGAGHGTHVSGIVAGAADNASGIAGGCWGCSILMAKATNNRTGAPSVDAFMADVASSLTWLVDHGAQVVSMSLGAGGLTCTGATGGVGMLCTALDLAQRRDVLMAASAGNDKTAIDFPASDPRVMSIGGIEPDGDIWDRDGEGEVCPCQYPNRPQWLINACNQGMTFECGSNFATSQGGPQQDLVAPASQVLSTFYENRAWNSILGCHDTGHAGVGYDLCTGTSMASPHVASIAGILRSVNPLLSKAQIESALTGNASLAGNRDSKLGYGHPNASASVQAVLGRANGTVLANRLTPLFVLYSFTAQDHLYTTFPQMGAAASWSADGYSPLGPDGVGWPDVPGYGYFPDAGCAVSPCLPEPGASVYVFTTDRSPNGHPLVPLYRMTFEGTFPGGPNNPDNRDTTFTTDSAGIVSFKSAGYELDGIEGYVYQRCTPEPQCIPAGAVRLYRLYNAARDDFAVFPESELGAMQAAGYASSPGLNDWIGYVYPNADGDFDDVINGFEGLIGTDPSRGDSDCDGLADGAEILGHPNTDPRIANGGSGCPIFADVPADYWARSFIETIYHRGVTTGCAADPLRYCPEAQLNRAEIAPFLLRSKLGGSYQPPPANCSSPLFADVPCTHWAAAWIEELARQGITGGCGGGSYCPDGLVDRSQAAVFLLRTLMGASYVPPPADCNAPLFSDVPCTHWAAAWIEEIARRGITAGCGPGVYCPGGILNRASMAVFLVRTFNF